MFTGIIQALGIVNQCFDLNEKKFLIETALNLANCKVGSSISCDGICLTTTSMLKINDKYKFEVVVSEETLKRSTAKFWSNGSIINIEKSLRVGDEIAGHFVYGHIDCIATLDKIDKLNSSWNYYFSFDHKLFKKYKNFIVEKGSISVNGISLTVAYLDKNKFSVSIIPHTYKSTNLSNLNQFDFVNIEFDKLAHYNLKLND